MSSPDPSGAAADRPLLDLSTAERAAKRSDMAVWSLGHLPICWAALGAGTAVLAVVGGLVTGWYAVWGTLIGGAIVGLFFTVSAVIIARVGACNPKRIMAAALATYVLKIVALGVVLTVMPRDGWVDTRYLAGSVGLGLFCWLGAHMRYVWTSKIFYVDPS
ncbi:hypothetical protein [Nakamurella aerolata]|uniref:ATP synthase protein I n=1 Tax=Nakamurella aerolata TaxID=1656892 RepID=A0A849A386_9ACTN|nr:hypothetical protein [Nakamurella aerolata]NNG34146.1 hypothetical protein [Nakamurella aerolata]